MKILRKILIGIFFAVIFAFIAACFFVQRSAKDFIQAQLAQSLKQPVQLSTVSYHFPVGFRATNVSIDDFLTVKRMYVQFNPKTLFEDKVEIAELELVEPSMVLSQTSEAASPGEPVAAPFKQAGDHAVKKDHKQTFVIKRMVINNGLLNYVNKKASQPITIEMTHLKGQLLDLELPLISQHIQYDFETMADIKNTPLGKNQLTAKGWIDLFKKDLQGAVHVLDQKGHEQMKVNLEAVNNDLTVNGTIKVRASQINDSASVIVNQLVQNGEGTQDIQLEAGFSFKRKLDDFRLDNLQIPFNGVVSSVDAP